MIRRISTGIRRNMGVVSTVEVDMVMRQRGRERVEQQMRRSSRQVKHDQGKVALPNADPSVPLAALANITHQSLDDIEQSLPHHLDRLAFSLYFSISMSSLQLFNCILLLSARAQRLLAIPSNVTLPLEVSRRGRSDGCCRTDHIGQDLDTRVCEPIVAQFCD